MKVAVIAATLLIAGLVVYGARTLALTHQTTAAHVAASQATPPAGDISQAQALQIGRTTWITEHGSVTLANGTVTSVTADYLPSAQVSTIYKVGQVGDGSQPYVWLITYHNFHVSWYDPGFPGVATPRSGFSANGYLIVDPTNGSVLMDFTE